MIHHLLKRLKPEYHKVLFLEYINDISKTWTSLTRLFADDTSFGYNSSDTDEIKTVVDTDPSPPIT